MLDNHSRRARQSHRFHQSRALKIHRPVCACEAVERRVLLSGATFATPTTIPVSGATAPLTAAFFEGEGYPVDLAVATPTAVQVYTNDGSGNMGLAGNVALPANPASQTPFVAGDFSGGGIDDLALLSRDAGTGNGTITYETSNGDGTFTAGSATNITDGGKGFTPLSASAADLNGDGNDDLAIIGKPGTGTQLVLAVMTSNGDGTFAEADIPIAGSNPAGTISNEEVFTDIPNEIVVYDGSGGNLDVFTGVGDGSFTQLTPAPLAASLVAIGTFNSNQDVVVADGDQISLLVNQNDGTFQADPQGPITMAGSVSALTVGDFDSDGNNDIISDQGILFGNGDKTFNTTPQALPISLNGGGGSSNTLQAVDFAGSGRQGFAGFSAAGNAIVTALNTGTVGVTVDLESSNNPAEPGSDVQLTVTVSSADPNVSAEPTGNVTFYDGSNALETLALNGNSVTFDAGSTLDAGTHNLTVQYTGDSNFSAGTSAPLTESGLTSTATALISSENPSVAGDEVAFTALVSGNDGVGDTPTGNVEFFDNGTDLGGGPVDATGTATFDTAGSLAAGSHSITAQYQGDNNFAASLSSAVTETVTAPALMPVISATTLPSAIVAGSKAHGTVTLALTNETSDPISADQITVVASSDGSLVNATALVVDVSKHGIPLKPGQTKVLKLTVKSFPTTLGNGTYRLIAEVSSSLSLNSNSAAGPSITVAAPFVQLSGVAGTGAVKPNAAKAGKFVSLTLALSNAGNITTDNATLNIGLSTDGQTESTVLENPSANIRIKPGHTGLLHLRVKIPTAVPAGSYQPFVSISDDGDSTTIIGQAFTVG